MDIWSQPDLKNTCRLLTLRMLKTETLFEIKWAWFEISCSLSNHGFTPQKRDKLMHGINDCMAKQKTAYHHKSHGETYVPLKCQVVVWWRCKTKNSTDPILNQIKDMSETIRSEWSK
jgi:hypothetical protein